MRAQGRGGLNSYLEVAHEGGEQHCTQAPRGERLNVMAALFSDGSVMHSSHWCSTTAELFLGFVAELAKTVTKTWDWSTR